MGRSATSGGLFSAFLMRLKVQEVDEVGVLSPSMRASKLTSQACESTPLNSAAELDSARLPLRLETESS